MTSHEIASDAGVAVGTFYNHFKDKQALFREIVFATIEQLKRDLISAGEGVSDREQKVRRRAEALVDFTERKTDLVRILFGRDREAAALGADVLDDLTAWLETEIRGPGPDLVHPGALVHPGIAAQAIVGMWARTLAWWAEAPGRAERQQLVDTIVELQLSGVSGTQT